MTRVRTVRYTPELHKAQSQVWRPFIVLRRGLSEPHSADMPQHVTQTSMTDRDSPGPFMLDLKPRHRGYSDPGPRLRNRESTNNDGAPGAPTRMPSSREAGVDSRCPLVEKQASGSGSPRVEKQASGSGCPLVEKLRMPSSREAGVGLRMPTRSRRQSSGRQLDCRRDD